LALGLIAAMIDFVIHGLMDMAYFTMDNALSFWLMLGLVVLLKRGMPDQPVKESVAAPGTLDDLA
jgi:hypothetical protein